MRKILKVSKTIRHLVGIDEVGRGPLAGPITVCAFCVPKNFNQSLIKEINSSKKLSPLQRSYWERILKNIIRNGQATYSVSSVSASLIDRKGISKTTKLAIRRALKKLEIDPLKTFIFLDGALKAPSQYLFQKTIIRGDEKVKIISCASVLAKERRDRTMRRVSKLYPEYHFEVHKGYGTKLHKSLIKKHGPSEIHRMSFLSGILN